VADLAGGTEPGGNGAAGNRAGGIRAGGNGAGGNGAEDNVGAAAGAGGDERARRQLRRRVLKLVGLAAVVGTFLTLVAVRHGYFDLRVYHGAINYWVHDGGLLYDYLLPESTYGFTYPPFAAMVMAPMAYTPWHLAIVLTCIACVAATGVLLYWLVDPVSRRQGWTRWYAFLIVFILAAAFEPLRETFLFGQVNMFLVFLVAVDLLLLVNRGSRFAGVAIGLATAIKLTPGIFIVYLLVTRRWRAAMVAAGTAAAATIVAAALFPDVSRVFWTDALWNTDRVGRLAFISNQSLYGAVARLNPAHPSTILWAVAVVAVLVLWFVRVRRAVAAGDEMTGFALTGILGCLMSPVTWVHHLVWVGPAVLLLLDNALATPDRRRRRRLLGFMIFSYLLLCSRLVWSFHERFYSPIGWFFSNSYVWISLALLAALPIRRRAEVSDGDAAGDAPAQPDQPDADRPVDAMAARVPS
jgi:alpha-1,2-mannosyltransferase